MNKVTFIVFDSGKEVEKTFDDLKKLRTFLIRSRYSKRILVTSVTTNSREESEYLNV